ncbi:pan apple domain-containing protein [Cystoisospora suis]|uniref:Pan apple domain-containing protein n=1 Tax=Cystoisospora suis TaxID=483139 RepID=A0A2C6KW92_9APIC|nr:pan apple domain-containing protein [Cystoisospora suis]
MMPPYPSSFFHVFPSCTPAVVLIVLAGVLRARVNGLRHEGHHLLLREQYQGAGLHEFEGTSVVQRGVSAVQKHSASVGDECFWADSTTTDYNVLRLQMEVNAGSVIESVKECQKKCRETSKCTMITYSKKTKICNIKMNYVPQLKRSRGEITVRAECDLPGGSDAFTEVGGCYRKDIGSANADITYVSTDSVEACQNECRQITNCTHFTYNVAENVCRPKSGKPTWKAYKGDLSATRDCNLRGERSVQALHGSLPP